MKIWIDSNQQSMVITPKNIFSHISVAIYVNLFYAVITWKYNFINYLSSSWKYFRHILLMKGHTMSAV